MSFELFIARRLYSQGGSRRRASRSAIVIATAGVALGIAVMVVSVSVVLGFKHEVQRKVTGIGSHIQVVNYQSLYDTESQPIVVSDRLVQRLRRIPGVNSVQRFCTKTGMLKTDDSFQGVMFKGIDRDYDLTMGTPGSKVLWFSANPNGEAEVLRVTLKPKLRLKVLQFDVDLSTLAIKGKQTRGNIVTRNEVQRITLKERGASTLGDREVWFDPDILRVNYEGHGRSLGLFGGDDRILVIMRNGEFYTTTADASNHYDDGILRIEKWRDGVVWTAVVKDAEQGNLL